MSSTLTNNGVGWGRQGKVTSKQIQEKRKLKQLTKKYKLLNKIKIETKYMTIPYITPKQQEIPKLLYKFRFINRLQIQKLLHHKYHKRIIDWLNDLVEKKYLEKVPKANSFEERTKLTVYRIGINGIRFLKTQKDCSEKIIRKLYKDNDRSDNFISNCQLLADICLDLKEQNKDGDMSYEVIMSSDLINTESPFHFLIDLNPSLVYKEIKKYGRGTKSSYFLLEAFETTLPGYSINKRIRAYLEFYYTNEWEDNMSKTFPTLKFICPTKADLINTKRYTKKLLEENDNPEDINIEFATIDEIKKSGIVEAIWEEVE